MMYGIAAYLIFALFNYRIAVFLLAPLSFLLYMFPVVDGQVLSILDCCCLGLTALLPIKTKFISKLRSYPFKIPSILVLISYCVTNLFAEPHWPSTVYSFNTIYIFPFIVWCVLDDEDDVKWLVKSFVAYFAFCAVYAIIELALDDNYILDYFITKRLVNANVWKYDEVRFGIRRLQSIFCTPMSMGLAVASLGYVLYERDKLSREKSLLIFLMIGGCFVLPWLTGSRSVFMAVFVMMFPVFIAMLKNGRFMLLKIAVIGGALFALGGWAMLLIDSFIHSDTAVTGSSFEMRLIQFAVVIPFFLNSPIWGNGYAYTWTFVKEVDADILGAESIWMQLLIDFGVLGTLAYISCIVAMRKNLKKYRSYGGYFPLAIIVAYTMSTFLGMDLNFFFILCMILMKTYEFEDEKKLEKKETAEDKASAVSSEV